MEFSRDRASTTKPPLLDGSNYPYWKVKMTAFLQSVDVDVWNCVEFGYTKPTVATDGDKTIEKPMPQWTKEDKQAFNWNSKALNTIFYGVPPSEFCRISICKSVKKHGIFWKLFMKALLK